MSDHPPFPPSDPFDPRSEQPPNWGSAYPSPPPGQPYGTQPPYGYPSQIPPKHPQATTSMVLGIVAIAGAFFCVLPIFLAPFAWVMGHKSVKAIDANPALFSGRGEASAGRILGIIGTALMVLAVLALMAFVVLVVAVGESGGFDSAGY